MARSTLMVAPSSSFVLATTCVFLLFLAVNGNAQRDGRLLGTWFRWTGDSNFTINEVDPTTGMQGKELFTSDQFSQLFSLTLAMDQSKQRIFVPLIHPEGKQLPPKGIDPGVYVVEFRIAEDSATIASMVSIPYGYFFAIQYDSVTNKVFLLAGNLNKREEKIHFFSVDLNSGTYSNLTTLPEGVIPSMEGIGGAASVFDEKNRLFIIGTVDAKRSRYSLTRINVDTLEVTQVDLEEYFPLAMYFDWTDHTIKAVLTFVDQTKDANSTFGLINKDGQVKPIAKWDNTFIFVAGSIATMDTAKSKFYSLMGSGSEPIVALVTIDATTGLLENYIYEHKDQPSSLIFTPF